MAVELSMPARHQRHQHQRHQHHQPQPHHLASRLAREDVGVGVDVNVDVDLDADVDADADLVRPPTASANAGQHDPKSPLESLPAEIVNQILSHLVQPRSRLPGLTEAQSSHDVPRQTKFEIKDREDLTTLPDAHRWAADIFDFNTLRHPFHVLALTSRRLHAAVEAYCAHLVRACNMFNLPFAHYDAHGPACVYPDLSQIVYRRLWLQHAPRLCIYCHAALDCYPFPVVKRLIAACEDCFYRQTLVRAPSNYHPANPY